MGKHSLPEASPPLRFCFQYSTVRKLQLMLQPVNSWPLKPSLASPKKPEKHQGTMVNALTRMCLKRISAKSREITTFYYKSHLVILKDYVCFFKKKKVSFGAIRLHVKSPAMIHARASLTRLQHCEIVQNLQVMNSEIPVLHIPPELCKVRQHSRWSMHVF